MRISFPKERVSERRFYGGPHPEKLVGFYFTPIYVNPALRSKLAPSLKQLLRS
jgi:hypothetical protein